MIIGLTGPICAGKDEVAKLLVEQGFERLSLVSALREEARARGIELTRKNLQDLGDELRQQQGTDVLARRVMKKIIPGRNYTMESIRNPGEVAALRELDDFVLLCVTASDSIRFERMIVRAREQDPRTFDDFLRIEARDRGLGQSAHGQQNESCWALADATLENNTSLHNLQASLKHLLSERGFVRKPLVHVVTAFPSEDAALELARALLEQRVIACAQVVSSKSIFWWQGKVQEVPEWICFMKGNDFSVIEKAIKEKHPYEVPEIVQMAIEKGNADYLAWLTRETA